MENQVGLQFLPQETIGEIASYLSTRDILACSSACFLLRQALDDDFLWKKRCSFKEPDYLKWGECEVEPDFEITKNEPSCVSLPKACDWRKYAMMQARLWRNWELGNYTTVDIEFESTNQVFYSSQILFYENDFLFAHSYDINECTLNTLNQIWCVKKEPLLNSKLNLSLKEYLPEEFFLHCSSKFKVNLADSMLVLSLKRLVLIYDLSLSSFSHHPLVHAFFFDGFNGVSHDTSESIVAGDYYIGAKKASSQNSQNFHLILYLWNIQTGEKIKEENFTLKNTTIDIFKLLKSEDNKHLILKLNVKKDRYTYHYYGYNISKLEFSPFVVKVNYCNFKIFYGDSVIGSSPQNLFLYSYKTSEKIANMKCNYGILQKTIKVVGGYLLFGTFENVVYVLNPSNFVVINTVQLGFVLYSINPILDKFVVINSTNCEVWKIGEMAKKLFRLPVDTSFAAVNRFGTKVAVTKRNIIKILNFW